MNEAILKWLTLVLVLFTIGLALFTVQIQSDNKNRNNQLRLAAIALCQNDKPLRTSANQRVPQFEALNAGIQEFLTGAVIARKKSGQPFDLEAVKKYEKILRDLRPLTFHPVPNPDCAFIVDHPITNAG